MGANLIRFILTTFFLFIFAIPAHAQEDAYYPIGKIVALEGTAHFLAGANKNKVHVDDPVYMNATLATDPGSKALIIFIDDTQLTLAESTELVIDEFVFDPYEAEENEAEFEIENGAFSWVSGMISKTDRPQVKVITGIGTMDIRGTKFWGGEIESGYGLIVEDGLVAFNGKWGTAEVPAGEGIFIPKDNTAKQNDFWNTQRREHAIKTVTFDFSKNPGLHEKIKRRLHDNIRERHDYRGRMFPYKKNDNQSYTPEKDEFFTDEFNEMRDKH